jgi:hypothetical protein
LPASPIAIFFAPNPNLRNDRPVLPADWAGIERNGIKNIRTDFRKILLFIFLKKFI